MALLNGPGVAVRDDAALKRAQTGFAEWALKTMSHPARHIRACKEFFSGASFGGIFPLHFANATSGFSISSASPE